MNRTAELSRLEGLSGSPEGGFAVLWGRRRIGKTRLLVEWCRREGGVYYVADQSAPALQRRALARALAGAIPEFDQVEYPTWDVLFQRLVGAGQAGWRGPLVLDEFPYLVQGAPELPSVLQAWLDHAAKEARFISAIAGSSQRMMQGMLLDPQAPLFGRADELMDLAPLAPRWLPQAFGENKIARLVQHHAAWGGVPRYWELAVREGGDVIRIIDRLVLDPLGPLHREPERLLLEELPPAAETKPVLDAIGLGAHRLSEIAGRLGRPATSLGRALDRLIGMQLIKREVPFGESEKSGKRSLYRLADPFLRLWFQVVAPNRSVLVEAPQAVRLGVLKKRWPGLVATAFEDLMRSSVGRASVGSELAALGPFKPASRWWQGSKPEWDIVAESVDDNRLLLGEVKWSQDRWRKAQLQPEVGRLLQKPPPELGSRYANHEVIRALFVPEHTLQTPQLGGAHVVSARDAFFPVSTTASMDR